jgi:hypothetical protein
VSYGRELNNFKERAVRYGPEWRGIVLCKTYNQLRGAMEDAKQFLGGQVRSAGQYMTLAGNGAKLQFRVCTNEAEAQHAVAGFEWTHIIWLHRPEDAALRSYVRSSNRSRKVPTADLRLEYCLEDRG